MLPTKSTPEQLLQTPELAFPRKPTLSAADKPKLETDFGAEYSVWNLQQHNFLLGAEHPLDDASYTVQNLRVKAAVGRPRYGIVARGQCRPCNSST